MLRNDNQIQIQILKMRFESEVKVSSPFLLQLQTTSQKSEHVDVKLPNGRGKNWKRNKSDGSFGLSTIIFFSLHMFFVLSAPSYGIYKRMLVSVHLSSLTPPPLHKTRGFRFSFYTHLHDTTLHQHTLQSIQNIYNLCTYIPLYFRFS